MADAVTKDSRGFYVVLPASTWEHARPHLGDFGGSYQLALQTLQDPDLILDNPQTPFQRRTALERYQRYFFELQSNIIIPVKLVGAGQTGNSANTVAGIQNK